jgi:hypothetical protein
MGQERTKRRLPDFAQRLEFRHRAVVLVERFRAIRRREVN